MALKVGKANRSEGRYTAKFKAMAANYGIFIGYEEDLAAVDLGLHITLDTEEGADVTNTRVWVQLKGIQKSKLPSEQYDANKIVAHEFKTAHLQHWYESSEVVYLVVYIASKNLFLAGDIKDLVSEGDIYRLPPTQKTLAVHFPKQTVINEEFWQKLPRHGSMRTDRHSHKGNALAHERGTDQVLQMPAASLFRGISKHCSRNINM